MPPVTPALHTYIHGASAGAVTGPIYPYDPSSASTTKWPPHFDGAWFVTDWVQGEGNNGFKGIKIFKLNAAAGPSRVTVRDAAGRLLFAARQAGPARHDLGNRLHRPGSYLVTKVTAEGARTLRFVQH